MPAEGTPENRELPPIARPSRLDLLAPQVFVNGRCVCRQRSKGEDMREGDGGSGGDSRKLGGGAIASITGLALLVIFIFQNTEDVRLDFLAWNFTWPVWLLTIVSAV